MLQFHVLAVGLQRVTTVVIFAAFFSPIFPLAATERVGFQSEELGASSSLKVIYIYIKHGEDIYNIYI